MFIRRGGAWRSETNPSLVWVRFCHWLKILIGALAEDTQIARSARQVEQHQPTQHAPPGYSMAAYATVDHLGDVSFYDRVTGDELVRERPRNSMNYPPRFFAITAPLAPASRWNLPPMMTSGFMAWGNTRMAA